MTTDFRALCAELLAHAERAQSVAAQDLWVGDEDDGLFDRARTALADGPAVPEGRQPSDEELLDLHDWMTNEWATNHNFELPSSQYARAVLARWGNSAPQHNPWKETLLNALVCNFLLNAENEDNPKKALNDLIAWEKQLATDPLLNPELRPVPVSERLPGDQLCWWYEPDEDDDGTGYGGNWTLLRIRGCVSYYTHWLPAHAIPLPTAND